MVGSPRGPSRPPMQPHHQLILKQVATPFAMITKPPAPNYVNYLSLPVMPANGTYLAVNSKPSDTNCGTILTVAPRNMSNMENNNSATFITMDNLPHSHQYLIPKPEPFAMHNYSKNESAMRRSPAATRPTNHQRIKEEIKQEEDDEGEEIRPRMDPSLPYLEQVVRIDHNYLQSLPSPTPPDDDKESTISSDEKVEHNEEGEETETAAEGEDSVTRCICNLEHDDGYMISCDQCYVWQHVACVLPDQTPNTNSLPDMAYLCDICQPRDLDRHRARALQMQRRKQILHREDSSNESGSSADRVPPPKKTVARRRAEPIPRRPSKRDSTDGPVRTKLDMRPKKSILEGPPRSKMLKLEAKKRRDSTKLNLMTSSFPPPVSSVGRRTKLKRKFERKANQRRKSKSKDFQEIKVEKEEDKLRPSELRPRPSLDRSERQTSVKSRCRLAQSPSGDPMVVATCRINCGDFLSELRGKYLQSSGCAPRAEVLFHYRFAKDGTEVLMDGSGRENIVRHAKRCCTPNAQLKHCMVKGSLRLYLVAIENLDRNQPILIPHGCVTEGVNIGLRESCGKDCTYNPNLMAHKTSPRRRSRRCTMSEESDREGEALSPLSPTHSERDRKLTREEKKIEQAMKIFAQMEKDTARKREKPPGSVITMGYRRPGDSDKESPIESGKPRRRRKRRRRRNSRKSRLTSGSGSGLLQAQSGDESDVSSGDDDDKHDSGRDDYEDDKMVCMDDAAGLLLALGGARHNPIHPSHQSPPLASMLSGRQTPPMGPRDHSENDSSPSTPLSSACLLVAAAVGPLAPGFKFPKTKKGLMNEWLGKSPEHTPSDLSPSTEVMPSAPHTDLSISTAYMGLPPGAPKLANLSNRLYYPARDQGAGFAGFGKKRWLRQAISEVIEPPLESPPCPSDNGTPLKKRRMARESLTAETPGYTPVNPDDDAVFNEGESPKSPRLSTDAHSDLSERVRAMQQGYLANQGIDSSETHVNNGVDDDDDDNLSSVMVKCENPCELSRLEKEDSPNCYDTSPQRVPENLTKTRPPSPPPVKSSAVLSSPPADPRPGRRGRKRGAIRNDPRTSPRGRRWARRSESNILIESNGQLESDCLEIKMQLLSDSNSLPVKVEKSIDLCPKNVTQDSSYDDTVDRIKAELSYFDSTHQYQGQSSMDVLAMEATKKLSEVTPEFVFEIPAQPKIKLEDFSTHVKVEPTTEESQDDKTTPTRRKLSITEYLKRKKGSESKSEMEIDNCCEKENDKSRPSSPASDDDISSLLMSTPTLPNLFMDSGGKGGRFKEEPTELERQRENLNERLRREFGLAINDEEAQPPPIPLPPVTPLPPPPSSPPISIVETNGYPETKLDFPTVQILPQSAIYPVGSSNPPNPFVTSFPSLEPRHTKFRK